MNEPPLKHPADAHVGERLRTARVLRGHSQTALGNAIGVTFQQVQKYEIGFNRISCSKLWEASQFLSVHPEYFFDGLSGPAVEDYSFHDDEPELAELVASVSMIGDRGLRKTIRALLETIVSTVDEEKDRETGGSENTLPPCTGSSGSHTLTDV